MVKRSARESILLFFPSDPDSEANLLFQVLLSTGGVIDVNVVNIGTENHLTFAYTPSAIDNRDLEGNDALYSKSVEKRNAPIDVPDFRMLRPLCEFKRPVVQTTRRILGESCPRVLGESLEPNWTVTDWPILAKPRN